MIGDLSKFDDALTSALELLGISARPEQIDSLGRHFHAMVDANRAFNLTRITDPAEAAVKHYADSLALLLYLGAKGLHLETVVDIGTGAGFPAVPLAVMRPEWRVTGIDATRKKTEFLVRTARALGLSNLHVAHAHSRHWRPGRTFQIATLRAIAKLATCLRHGARCLSTGGRLVAYKSFPIDVTEHKAASAAAARLGLIESEPFPYELNHGGETIVRALYVFDRPAGDPDRPAPSQGSLPFTRSVKDQPARTLAKRGTYRSHRDDTRRIRET